MPPRAPAPASASATLPFYARTAGRGVRLQIRPRPRSIQDRRHILAHLRAYGPIVLFQSLKYDAPASSSSSSSSSVTHSPSENIALALYRSQAAAEKVLAASPLRLEVGGPAGARLLLADAADDTVDDAVDAKQEQNHPGSRTGTETEKPPAVFKIWVERSGPGFHARQMRHPYAGPFAYDRGSAMVEDLRRRVPIPALADCRLDKGPVPLRVRRKAEEEATGPGGERWAKGASLWEMWTRQRGQEQEASGTRRPA